MCLSIGRAENMCQVFLTILFLNFSNTKCIFGVLQDIDVPESYMDKLGFLRKIVERNMGKKMHQWYKMYRATGTSDEMTLSTFAKWIQVGMGRVCLLDTFRDNGLTKNPIFTSLQSTHADAAILKAANLGNWHEVNTYATLSFQAVSFGIQFYCSPNIFE